MDTDQRDKLEREKLIILRSKLDEAQLESLDRDCRDLRGQGIYAIKFEIELADILYEDRAFPHQSNDRRYVLVKADAEARARRIKEKIEAVELAAKEEHARQESEKTLSAVQSQQNAPDNSSQSASRTDVQQNALGYVQTDLAAFYRAAETLEKRTEAARLEIIKEHGAEFEKQAELNGELNPERRASIADMAATILAENQTRPGTASFRDESKVVAEATRRLDQLERGPDNSADALIEKIAATQPEQAAGMQLHGKAGDRHHWHDQGRYDILKELSGQADSQKKDEPAVKDSLLSSFVTAETRKEVEEAKVLTIQQQWSRAASGLTR